MELALEILAMSFVVIAIAWFAIAHALGIGSGLRERETRSDRSSRRRPF
jgi:hypothetical protein